MHRSTARRHYRVGTAGASTLGYAALTALVAWWSAAIATPLGAAPPQFTSYPVTNTSVCALPVHIAAADVNADGFIDIVVGATGAPRCCRCRAFCSSPSLAGSTVAPIAATLPITTTTTTTVAIAITAAAALLMLPPRRRRLDLAVVLALVGLRVVVGCVCRFVTVVSLLLLVCLVAWTALTPDMWLVWALLDMSFRVY